MVLGMEVFRRDFESKGICEELVDGRDDVASTCYCERSVLSLLIGRQPCKWWVLTGGQKSSCTSTMTSAGLKDMLGK